MGKCNTLDGQLWTSEINGQGDGQVEIGDDASGRFTGKHKKNSNEKPLSGRCRDHSIWFIVPENRHLYVGGFANAKRIEGTRFNLDELPKLTNPPAGDEDWVATKT